MTKKILYLMHTPWGLVKQRPHFIANYLNDYYNVQVFYKGLFKKEALVNNENHGLYLKSLYRLPFDGFNTISKINSYLIKSQLKGIISQFDLIWITNPIMFDSIDSIIPKNTIVIYDCMDDVLEFPYIKSRPNLRDRIHRCELKLIDRSDIVFCTSEYLIEQIKTMYNPKNQIYLINNALDINNKSYNSTELPLHIEKKFNNSRFIISYIGTISEWFDTEILIESLNEFKNIHYFLFGPCGIKLPKNKRIIHFGPVEHKYVNDIMYKSDALIMPFKINDLVRSVDPVKLYEYIYSCKPVLARKYGETLKFKDYVYLYENKRDYLKILNSLMENKSFLKKNCKNHRTFSKNNTWKKRVNEIVKIIEKFDS